MRKVNLGEGALFIRKTGEIFEEVYIPLKKSTNGRWLRIFIRTLLDLNRQKLRGESYRVFLELLGRSENNRIPEYSILAGSLNLKISQVGRSIKELKDRGFIIKFKGDNYLSPFLCWMSNDDVLDKFCKEICEESIKEKQRNAVKLQISNQG